MFPHIGNKLKEMAQGLKDEVARLRNKTFMEACVAGCAMIANADGVVSAEEKRKTIGFMETSDVLSLYDTDEVIALFEKYCGKYAFDGEIGAAQALRVIAPLRSKPAEARLLVRACCVIAGADGNFDNDERRAVRMICDELGLDATEFLPGK
jgi:tellurite resistance protein TerB